MADGDSQKIIPGAVASQPDARTRSADVFISYASADKAAAEAICAALERGSIRCWMAPRDVTPGAFYADAIVQGINSARILIIVLSANSAGSQHVLREVERASAKRRPLVAFRLDGTPLPPGLEYFLSASHWLDASVRSTEQVLPALLDAVRRLLESPDNAVIDTVAVKASKGNANGGDRASMRPASQVRRLWAAAAVAAVLITATLAFKFWPARQIPTESNKSVAWTNPASLAAAVPINTKSVAVLPFADMSEKRDQEYFSDGMAEEIIDLLVKIPDLRVPARTSAFYFKGKQTKIPDIARELGVANVLEGSVRRFGDHLRVTAQLVRADTGYHLWSETYDRQMTDVFTVQDEIAVAVVKALKASLLEPPAARSVTPSASEAYTIYLQGRSIFERAGSAGMTRQGIDYLEKAAKLDPNFAPVWATLSRAYVSNYLDYSVGARMQVREKSYGAAERAIKLDAFSAEAHMAMERVLMTFDWNWTGAEREMHRARELGPANAEVARNAYYLFLALGRFDEAMQHARKATILDPLNYYNYLRLGEAEFYSGELAQADVDYRKALDLEPNADGLHVGLAYVLLAKQQPLDALAEANRETEEAYKATGLPRFLDAAGRKDEADRALALAESKYGSTWPFNVGELYASRHDLDRAFIWWDRAYRQHDGPLEWIKCAPTDTGVKDLVSDARFKDLLRKMNLPE